jgi:hypothetical protein
MKPLDIVVREANNCLYVVEQVEGNEVMVRTLQGSVEAERWQFKASELRVVAKRPV